MELNEFIIESLDIIKRLNECNDKYSNTLKHLLEEEIYKVRGIQKYNRVELLTKLKTNKNIINSIDDNTFINKYGIDKSTVVEYLSLKKNKKIDKLIYSLPINDKVDRKTDEYYSRKASGEDLKIDYYIYRKAKNKLKKKDIKVKIKQLVKK